VFGMDDDRTLSAALVMASVKKALEKQRNYDAD
jgi:hypothetical protein